MGNIAIWWALTFIGVVWMVATISKTSGGLAFLTFFFWPISIGHLLSNWGDPDDDIRLPFLITMLGAGMAIYTAVNAFDDMTMQYSEQDIARLQVIDPETAAFIEARQAALISAEFPQGQAESESSYASASTEYTAAPVAAPTIREVPIERLNFRSGNIRIDAAYSAFQLPRDLRFLSFNQLGLLSKMRVKPIEASVFGWLVHERTDFQSNNFWLLEVAFYSGYIAAPTTPAVAVKTTEPGKPNNVVADGATAMQEPYMVSFDAQAGSTSWQWPSADANIFTVCAARLMRHGILEFCIPDIAANAREAARRETQAIAADTRIDAGWAHANFKGNLNAERLDQWVARRAPVAAEKPAVPAEAETVE